MTLTKEDLQEWNSHPVTKFIFKQIKESIEDAMKESCLMPTADETAMRVAHREGAIFGAGALIEAYEDALEEDCK